MKRKSNSCFQFKQFRVDQGQCAMKVTLDACLFGASIEVADSKRILDIGTGTGLLSLMAAQRCNAKIDAIELNENAVKQAKENFRQSLWHERLNVIHSAIQDLPVSAEQYDTIICNPPFFHNALKAPDAQRNMARHTCSLSFEDLAKAIDRQLTTSGNAWLLLPTVSTPLFLEAIKPYPDLKLRKQIAVRSKPGREDHRHFLTITKQDYTITEQMAFCIHTESGGYSGAVKKLLSDYYTKPLA